MAQGNRRSAAGGGSSEGCFEEGSQTADTQDSLFGLSRRCIPSWVIYAPRAAFGGCAPKHACGRSPAHTLYPQGVCSIRKAAEPLTAALPYRHGGSTTLPIVSHAGGAMLPRRCILGGLRVYW